MVQNFDTELSKLFEEVKQLSVGKSSFLQPSEENIAPGEYQSPIKADWRSSGGFEPTGQLRPNGRRGHMGVDMRAPAGTPIYPLAPGVVTSVGTDPLGGNVVNIQHANGVRSYYAHCSTVVVNKGDKVDNNTVIATVGTTGNAINGPPHLHFQVWKDNQIQDPAKYFAVPRYTEMTAEEKRRPWVSEQARQEAAAFNMQQHLQQKRVAFSQELDRLLKIADRFCKLAVNPATNNTNIL